MSDLSVDEADDDDKNDMIFFKKQEKQYNDAQTMLSEGQSVY
jgi:hypothetical protein